MTKVIKNYCSVTPELDLTTYRLIWKFFTDPGYHLNYKLPNNAYDILLKLTDLPYHGQLPSLYNLYIFTKPDPCHNELVKESRSILITLLWNTISCYLNLDNQHYLSAIRSYFLDITNHKDLEIIGRDVQIMVNSYTTAGDCVDIMTTYLGPHWVDHHPNYTYTKEILTRFGFDRSNSLYLSSEFCLQPVYRPHELMSNVMLHSSNCSDGKNFQSDVIKKSMSTCYSRGFLKYTPSQSIFCQNPVEKQQVYETHYINLDKIYSDEGDDPDQEFRLVVDLDDQIYFQSTQSHQISLADQDWNVVTLCYENNDNNDDQCWGFTVHHYYRYHLLCYLDGLSHKVCIAVNGHSCNSIMNRDDLYPCPAPVGHYYREKYRLENNKLVLAQSVLWRLYWQKLKVLTLPHHNLLVQSLDFAQIKSINLAGTICDLMIINDDSLVWTTLVRDIGELLINRACSELGMYLRNSYYNKNWSDHRKINTYKPPFMYSKSDLPKVNLMKWYRKDREYAMVALSNSIKDDGSVDIGSLSLQISVRKKIIV